MNSPLHNAAKSPFQSLVRAPLFWFGLIGTTCLAVVHALYGYSEGLRSASKVWMWVIYALNLGLVAVVWIQSARARRRKTGRGEAGPTGGLKSRFFREVPTYWKLPVTVASFALPMFAVMNLLFNSQPTAASWILVIAMPIAMAALFLAIQPVFTVLAWLAREP